MPNRLLRSMLLGLTAFLPLLGTAGEVAISSGSLVSEIADCRIKLIDEVVLASEQSGIVNSVEFKEGEIARKDEVVAAIRDNIVRSALATAEREAENDIEIRYAQKAADLARIAYTKAMQSNQALQGSVPEIEVRELRLAAEKAILQVEQAEHRLSVSGLHRDEARELLNSYVVQAPFDGVVTKVYKRRGEAVRQGEPILELSNATRMRVEGYIPLKDAWQIRPGAAVSIQIAAPEGPAQVDQMSFAGQVTLIDTKVEPVTQTVRIWAEVANRDEILKDGLTGVMRVYRNPQSGGKPHSQSTAARSVRK